MLIRKQDIYQLELEHWATLSDEDFERNLANSGLDNHSTWLLPQLVAHFGRWRLSSTGEETVRQNCQSALDKVLWRLTRFRRSYLIRTQTKQPDYGQLTPLVLLGFKRSQSYSYEQFRELSGLKWLLEPELYKALVTTQITIPAKNRLLQIRDQGLIIKTGKNAGTQRNPEATWRLYGIQDTELGGVSELLQTMLTQCWLAHPKHRRETMILDPNDWDNMPEPLIDVDLIKPVEVNNKPVSRAIRDVPW